ncbi:MAG: hypothetical protein JSU70_12240 [Phycisphaerales bacterium]|nr:MAG: hypothetical protein JSU70_12240 [Phycisphaerales bacterium]
MIREWESLGRPWAFLAALLLVMAAAIARGPAITSPYCKNEIAFPDDPFRVEGSSAAAPGWVKFTILLEPYDPNVVYFQDGHEYTFHYHFATELLEPFIGMTTEQFNQATLFRDGRKAILGAVILPPKGGDPPPPEYPEYGIQFVGHDVYDREEIARFFDVVKGSIVAEPGVQAFYFPSYEQLAAARANRDWFEEQGMPVSSPDRWAQGNTCYSTGWALGKLKYISGGHVNQAYLTGQLEPNDILLTDGVPAEVPFVAGIITLSPSTPNSHVAILAKTFGVPFVHLAVTGDADRATGLIGHRVVLRAYEKEGSSDVRLIDVEGVLDENAIADLLKLKAPPVLDIEPATDYGSYSSNADGLLPSDIKYFGGKASNFGILRTAIPEDSPVAVAFSFDLWKEFLDQQLATGNTLREEIEARLAPFTYPPSNMAQLSGVLNGIRSLFRDNSLTSFTPTQQQAIVGILQDPQYGFDPNKKIRFRSSTNVEDSEQFTGAGLYDSYSGCLADDLDGNTAGPCHCDPDNGNERGVFRAVRRVFASFYNDNAYLERLRHGVDEDSVGMALLVHHSFPDEIELANGVGTIHRRHSSSWAIDLVTQHGATSVTNPTDGSIPEHVSVQVYSFGAFPTLVRESNLVPLGAKVMRWQDDYEELVGLLVKVAERFSDVTGQTRFVFETEYKKVAPDGKLVVKQVRQIPEPNSSPTITPFLVNEAVEYCTFQGEFGDVFANHRLKSRWLMETKNLWLASDNLIDCLYAEVEFEYVADGRVRALTSTLPLLPRAAHKYDGVEITDEWVMHHLSNPRVCGLVATNIPIQVSAAESPILTLRDFGCLILKADHERAVPAWDWDGPKMTVSDSTRLCPCQEPQAGDLLQQRHFQGPNGVTITTSFYWPPPPKGFVVGYTAPLIRWVETVIEGHTSVPIILHGYYSQTYRPEHHNFDEHFLFEPRLEPGLSEALLAELRAQDIRLIHARGGMHSTEITTYGFEGESFLPGDLDDDEDADMTDYALFASKWLETACDTCGGADLTGDGRVMPEDMCEFADSWLVGTE